MERGFFKLVTMKVKVIKDHHFYPIGEHEMIDERAKYLISIGVAEEVKEEKPKEKQENKTANVPTAKKGKV